MPCPHCGGKINICTSCAYNQEDEFIRCPNCGKIVEFCANCGTKLYAVPNKEKQREFDKAFSKVFGYNVNFDIKMCPKCKREIGDAPFCPFCGCDITGYGHGTEIDSDYEVDENIYDYLNDPQYQYNQEYIDNFFANPIKAIFDLIISAFIPNDEPVQQVFPEFNEDEIIVTEKPQDEFIREDTTEQLQNDFVNKDTQPQIRDFNTIDKKSSGSGILYLCIVLVAIALFILYKTFIAG